MPGPNGVGARDSGLTPDQSRILPVPPQDLGLYLWYKRSTYALTSGGTTQVAHGDPNRAAILFATAGGIVYLDTISPVAANVGIGLPLNSFAVFNVNLHGTFPQLDWFGLGASNITLVVWEFFYKRPV